MHCYSCVMYYICVSNDNTVMMIDVNMVLWYNMVTVRETDSKCGSSIHNENSNSLVKLCDVV